MVDISKLAEWRNLLTIVFVALCLSAGLLLFPGDSFLESLGLLTFVESYRPYIGVTFLATLAMSLVASFIRAAKFIYPWIAQAGVIMTTLLANSVIRTLVLVFAVALLAALSAHSVSRKELQSHVLFEQMARHTAGVPGSYDLTLLMWRRPIALERSTSASSLRCFCPLFWFRLCRVRRSGLLQHPWPSSSTQ